MLYWSHRLFHGGGFWKYHAVHSSSEELDWISAARFHPVNLVLGTIAANVILLMAGISPNVMLWVGPLTTFHSAFVHANLNWTLGPFKYVLATPVFHRSHRTAAGRRRRHQFRRLVSDLGPAVRDLPDAGRQAARNLREGRSGDAAGSVGQLAFLSATDGRYGLSEIVLAIVSAIVSAIVLAIVLRLQIISRLSANYAVSGAVTAAYCLRRLVHARGSECC